MMKFLFSLLLIVSSVYLAGAQSVVQKQIILPLDNTKGVPYYIGQEVRDYAVDGFEVGPDETLYFLGGNNKVCVAAFADRKLLYRRLNPELGVGTHQLYFDSGKLYTYNVLQPNKLLALSATDGTVNKIYNNDVSERVNSFHFFNGSLILELSVDAGFIDQKNGLTGKLIGTVTNEYALPFKPDPEMEYLGTWKRYHLFRLYRNGTQKVYLLDVTGKTLINKTIPSINILGRNFMEAPPDHQKIRNDNLYILRRKDKSAVVTVISLKLLFAGY